MCLDDYQKLAHLLGTPAMFANLLPLLVKHEEVELLLKMCEKERSIRELSELLSLPQTTVQSRIDVLYGRGFLKRKRGSGRYRVRSFEQIIGRHLSEGRVGDLGKYVAVLADYLMDGHASRARADPYPESKVLPVLDAVVDPVSVVLPYETAVSILEKARSASLRDCDCRVRYRNCAKPLRTCLAINEFSDELVERGVAKEVSREEAKNVLRIAHAHGLVNQALYTDWLKGEVFDICSCCSCCCEYLRAFMKYGVKHHIAKSGLIAKVDNELCAGCGVCLQRCIFQARKLENGKSVVIEENCYGCGLCTTTCGSHACSLVAATA
jgi:DNA-binding transcriptional ArsR family regulator/ferredoxin